MTDAGLVNGAMGTDQAICYQSGGLPSLPVAVMVRFDKYWGPTLHDGSVPIVPNDVPGYKVVVHAHGYRSPSNLLGQS